MVSSAFVVCSSFAMFLCHAGTQLTSIHIFNPFMPNGLFYLLPLDRSISNRRVSGSFFIFTIFYKKKNHIFNENSVDLGQHFYQCPFLGMK